MTTGLTQSHITFTRKNKVVALEAVKDENTEELALDKAVVDPNDIGQIK